MANTIPTLAGLNAPTFLENAVNGAAQLIDANVTLTDPDGNFSGGILTVSGLLAEDILSIRNQGTGAGQVGFSNGVVTYGGAFVGFAGMVGGAFSVLFNASATTAAVDAVMENLTYANSSDAPTAGRTLEFTVTDAAGASAVGPLSFVRHTGSANPFDGVDIGDYSKPTFTDLDGDGRLDAIVGGNVNLYFFKNIGTASAPVFAAPVANPFGLTSVGLRITPTFGDLDGDGDLDALVGEFDGFVLNYFENTGTANLPSFATAVENPFSLPGVPRDSTPAFVDLDGDGDLDVVVGDVTAQLAYFRNNGTPAFATETDPSGWVALGFNSAPTLADLDGDGDFDVLVGEENGDLNYFENIGTPNAPAFAAPVANPAGLANVGVLSAPAFADLDGDGDFDVIVGEQDGTLSYFENTTPRRFEITVTVTSENDAPTLAGALADQTSPEDQALSFTIPANAFADADGNPLSYTATLADGSALPAWLAFDTIARTFSGTPPVNFTGTLDIKVTASDGTASASGIFTLTVAPVNDAPVVMNAIPDQTSPEDSVWSFAFDANAFSDPDSALGYFVTLDSGDPLPGWLTFTPATRTFFGTPPVNFTGTLDIKVTASDGTASTSDIFTLTLTPVNDAPVAQNGSASGNEDTVVTGALTATDVDSPSLAYSLVTQAAHGSVTVSTNGTFSYTPDTDFSGIDSFTFKASDGSLDSTAATVNLTIDAAPVINGTSGDDNLAAPAGSAQANGLDGIDTIMFNFKLTDATVAWSDNQVIIDGPSSHTALTGFEKFMFTDGTVNMNDADALIDDLFYYSKYHDVWNAKLDADAHYHAIGWHEGRDPSAFFSTSFYRALYPDVTAAGLDPLAHWHASGWSQGRLPSLAFDGGKYLAANPDVAAAHVDPLWHFLAVGASEGRLPFAPTKLIAANGFDSVYYLNTYADVEAAGLDPLWHFQNIGWKEGRDPNALFDTSGYLATYTDVAAAHINPFDHYNSVGWHEGRDPSVGFDTTSYLAAYPDVTAANINPLTHFLVSGQQEGRSPFADGVWG